MKNKNKKGHKLVMYIQDVPDDLIGLPPKKLDEALSVRILALSFHLHLNATRNNIKSFGDYSKILKEEIKEYNNLKRQDELFKK